VQRYEEAGQVMAQLADADGNGHGRRALASAGRLAAPAGGSGDVESGKARRPA
jgi:hypothetical protein